MILDKIYDKDGNELPQDYHIKEFPELQNFLTEVVLRLRQRSE